MSDRVGGEELWSGRFSSPPAPEARALGTSLRVDARLAAEDIRVSVAHIGALQDAGLLDPADAAALEDALTRVGSDIAAGGLPFDEHDEDIHSVIERAVTDRLGEAGARLHAGRSRNDLVVTDLRLWLLAAGERITSQTVVLAGVLVARAREHANTVMPGTTHDRLAQPVTLGHHLLAHAWALDRDLERLDDWSRRTSTSALGAGAIATSTLGLDPDSTAERLGMRRAFANSIDAVSDRDFVQEFLSVAAILATHASRLGADLARWSAPALGWAQIDEAYSTGSSMMPQKRNPDTAELARAKAARVAAAFGTLASVLHGLPLGYHRDLQEDKEPAFDAADTLELVLPALIGAMRTVTFDPSRMRSACADDGLYATDLAEALVAAGVPFREAHRRTGELFKRLAGEDRSLGDLDTTEWEAFGLPEGASLRDPGRSVRARRGRGGPSPRSVEDQAELLERNLAVRRIPS